MKRKGEPYEPYDSQAETTILITKFLAIMQEINRKRMPPIPSFIGKMMKERYYIEMSDEEIEELREYVETEYTEEASLRILEEYQNRMIEPINPQDRRFFES